ncbi:MAG: ATP-binding cassette domain-containing protein [Acidimicrobiia bacterium]|nr:ATP-binding cassette domain-containing protein [Acidimicrobiia bacterium]
MIELLGLEVAQQAIIIGLVVGLTYAALAAGFVLIYRATGVLNFAHGEMGFFGLALFVLMVVNYEVNWWLAFVLAIAATAFVGMSVELIVVRRLFQSPRLVLLIATIGVGQILTLARVGWIPDITTGGNIPTAFEVTWEPTTHIRVSAREVSVLVVVPVLIGLLGLFLAKTRFGLAVRACAANPETARVYGISPRQVSTIVWTIAGGFSAATAVLVAPLQGLQSATVDDTGNLLVEELLLKVLVVSLLAKMSSLPGVVWAGAAVGVVESIARDNVHSSNYSIVNVWFFITVLLLVLWFVRAGKKELGWSLAPTLRPIPPRLRNIWWVRNLNKLGFVFLFGLLALVPLAVTDSAPILTWTNILIFAMVALSLTVLTGWAGQLSLGQFALVGVGGLATLAFTEGHDVPIPLDLFDLHIDVPWGVAVVMATALGVVVAVLVGLPALRVQGLFLAVTTLAFAVMAGTWAFRQGFFSGGTSAPRPVDRPELFGVDLGESRRTMYLFCLVVLMVLVLMLARLRASGVGRCLIAVRDNENAAASCAVPGGQMKLTAFALAGGMAALAGALFVIAAPSLSPTTQFAPAASIRVLVIAVVGGLGTVAGPLLGSLWILGIERLIPDQLQGLQQLLTSNIGLLVLLMYIPGGLIQIVYSLRDALLGWVDRRLAKTRSQPTPPVANAAVLSSSRARQPRTAGPALVAKAITVRFGGNVALNQVDFEVGQTELVGLIGANGAGKSTLLNAIGGFVPAQGTVELLGVNVSAYRAAARHRVGLGRGFQAARLYPGLTVCEAIMVGLEARSRSRLVPSVLAFATAATQESAKRKSAADIIDFLGLGDYAERFIGTLSTGTRRVVELGCLLAVDARVLLLDEPTAGLTQQEAEAFGSLIKTIQSELNAAAVVIEHDMALVMNISDRVYCLESGIVIANGSPEAVRNDSLVIASYLGTNKTVLGASERTPS